MKNKLMTLKMRLNLKLFLVFLGVSVFTCFGQAKEDELIKYVDPFIGTQFFGHTFPGPSLPYAMVHLGPDTGTEGWTYCGGYVYADNSIIGFSHTHWSGVGMVDGGDVLLMPTVGNKLQLVPGTAEEPDAGYRSRFDHSDEKASPGYYAVLLKDYGIKAELTTTRRVGFHRYRFPKADDARVILDLGHQIGGNQETDVSELRILDNQRIEGVKGSGAGKVYFVAEFSKPFQYYGTFDASYSTPESGAGYFPYKSGERGVDIGAFVTFQTKDQEQVLVKVALSYVSIDGARKNMEAELPHWDFDLVKQQAEDVWNSELSRVQLEGATDDQKTIFYTAMYRSLLAQYISQDADGKYMGASGAIKEAKGFDFYGSFSCWDTYRSQHPLLTLIAPDHVNDFIKSIEAKIRDYGWLPAQHFQNVFGQGMVGDHLVPVIVDAYRKGYRDYDVDFIYNAMRKKAREFPAPLALREDARSGLEYLLKLGYVPVDKIEESVPKTLEFAYDDWCIAQMAKDLGKLDDYQDFMKSAANYKNVWDESTQFMRPRKSDGSWLEALNGRDQHVVSEGDHSYYAYFDPLLVGRRPNRYYTESNAWQYLWSVQHDVNGLIQLFRGKENFVDKLDTFFEMSPLISLPKYVGVVGTIGQYVHGNQPSHHVAYLYNYAGQPWKTQKRVRQVVEQLYRTGPGGLCGNEDMGSLSSWYVLSSLGFYAVTPGSPTYVIGSPLFGEVRLKVENGKTFTVKAVNNSTQNKYIQSAMLNGKPFSRTWISHAEIMEGGVLEFQMGPKPQRGWGTGISDVPPSLNDNL
ncbi:GH92 family glycosyl hydrolase [Sunxiuqinia rutila]|uniref:GH92 family glycosyl hydrolase n=1 Tax=Sunxiuqinia rutila TaxID=1397841 RepID=UPI003D369ED6